MNDSQQLREQIWDYVYGLLSDSESQALIARVKSDPKAARMYAEVRLQADLVGRAARVEDGALVLKGAEVLKGADTRVSLAARPQHAAPAGPRAARATPAAWANRLSALAAVALAGVLAVGFLWPGASERQVAASFIATDILAARTLPAGLTAHVSLQTYRVAGDNRLAEPAAASATVRLVARDGQERLRKSVQTDAAGQVVIELPGDALEPGVTLAVDDARPLIRSAAPAPAAARFESASTHTTTVSAALPVQAEPVMAYFLLAEPAVDPGKEVPYSAWNVTAFSAKPAEPDIAPAAGEATVSAPLAKESESNRPQPGLASSSAPAPASAAAGPLTLQLNQSGADQYAAPLARSGQQPPAYRSPTAQSRSLGTGPGEAQVVVRQRGQRSAAEFRELPEKKLSQNSAAKQSEVDRAARPLGEASRDASEPLPASPPVATIAAGEPIKITIPAELAGRPLLATAVCRGVTVATSATTAVLADKAADGGANSDALTIDLPPEVDGLIDVEIFDRSASDAEPAAHSTVYRQPQRTLHIELPAAKQRFALGETVDLNVQVRTEGGQPAAATRLGIRVWNEQLVEQAAEQPVLLADAVRSVSNEAVREVAQQQALQDLPHLTERGAAAERGKDLPAVAAANAALESGADSRPVELASSRGQVEQAIRRASARAQEQRQQVVRGLGWAAIAGGGLVLLVLAAQGALRMSSGLRALVPAGALAVASLLIGIVWVDGFAPHPRDSGFMVASAKPEASAAPAATASALTQEEGIQERAAGREAQDFGQRTDLLATDEKGSVQPAIAGGIGGRAAPAQPLDATGGQSLAGEARPPQAAYALQPRAETLAVRPGSPPVPAESEALRRQAGRPARALAASSASGRSMPLAPVVASGGAAGPPAAPIKTEISELAVAPLAGPAAQTAPAIAPGGAAALADKAQAGQAPAALYFNPQLVTDAEGRANVQFTMPPVNARYRVLIDALGQGRIGSRQDTIVCENAPAK